MFVSVTSAAVVPSPGKRLNKQAADFVGLLVRICSPSRQSL